MPEPTVESFKPTRAQLDNLESLWTRDAQRDVSAWFSDPSLNTADVVNRVFQQREWVGLYDQIARASLRGSDLVDYRRAVTAWRLRRWPLRDQYLTVAEAAAWAAELEGSRGGCDG